jgi:hypothetical protein
MTTTAPRTSSKRGYYVGAVTSLLAVLALYGSSLAPTVQGFDSAELTVGAHTLGFVHPPGYPVYMVLGHLFSRIPIGNVGLRLNLMSAVFGSLTAFTLYRLLYVQTRAWATSLVTTLLFATAPYLWSQAVQAEVYTLHTLLIAAALLAWFKAYHLNRIRSPVICFALLGLGMGNHLTTALLWIAILLSTIWEPPRWRRACLGWTLLAIVIGAAGYVYFPWRSRAALQVDYIRPYFDVDLSRLRGLWWLVSGQAFHHAFYLDAAPTELLQGVSRFGAFLWNGSLGIGLVLGAWGWWRLREAHPSWNRLLSIYLVLNFIAFLLYHVVDREAMFLPAYLAMGVWITHGIQALIDWGSRRSLGLSSDRVQVVVNLALLSIVTIGVGFNWRAVDLSHNRRTYDFARQLLDDVAPSTTIVNHWTTAAMLDYLRIVEGLRPDVRSFNLSFYSLGLQDRYGSLDTPSAQSAWLSWLTKQAERTPLCFVEPVPAIPEGFELSDQGSCWKLVSETEK